MSTTHRTVAAFGLNFVSLLAACVLIAGCAAGGGAGATGGGAGSGASPSQTGPAVTTPAQTPTPATSSGGPTSMEAATIVLRGTMIESVEANCRILEADNSRDTYQLVGLPDELADPGTRVEVRGHVAHDMVSFCMQGTIFKVSSAHRI